MQKVDYHNKEKRGPKVRKSVPLEAGLIGSISESRELKARDLIVPLRRGKSRGLGMKNHRSKLLTFIISLIFLLGTLASCNTTKPVTSPAEAALQHHTFAQLDSLMAIDPRPVAVFLHADWCRFCKNMEQTTFKNKDVIDLLNKKFYFISFDGEQKERVYFNQQIFDYQPSGRNTGTHDLAKALGTIDGVLTYPGFVILNAKYEITFQHNAYLSAASLQRILGTVGE